VANPTNNQRYALITAAHNEEALIEGALRSVSGQSVRPIKWIIVSDASTDRTDEIVTRYAVVNPFIQLLRLDQLHRHDFGAKAHAIKSGYELLGNLEYAYIGILDADTSFDPDYYCRLLELFKDDPSLGITGGFIHERQGGVFSSRRTNRIYSVAGATQFFRRECFEEIGGIVPLSTGGEDWCAEVTARMRGWDVRASPQLKIFHHRPANTVNGWLRRCFLQGRMDYSMGCSPPFEVVKCAVRLSERPFGVGALVRLAGFAWSHCVRADRAVSKEFIRFLRKEQRQRLWGFMIPR
jgi:hypothetical protein